MDQYLDLTLSWFKKLRIENINIDKLKRQLTIIEAWFKNNANGCVLAVTGFGKTMVAIITIHRLNLKFPTATINVIVPSLNLYQDWIEHIENFELKNVNIYVVNGYAGKYLETGIKYNCDLLIVDEVHNILSEDGKVFNQTLNATNRRMFMGLSATLDETEIDILHRLEIPIVDQVTMSEARRFNYISDYIIYNLGVELTTEEREKYTYWNDVHNSNFAKFRYFVEGEKNYELARACTAANEVKAKVGNDWRTGRKWREWYSQTMGWDNTEEHPWNPKAIAKYAHQWNWAMGMRKDYIYKHSRKLEVAKDIIKKFDVPTITFGQLTETADRLTEMLNAEIPGDKARSYHTGVESKTIKEEYEKRLKLFKSAKLFRQRTQGILTVDTSNGKPEYIIKYFKDVLLGKAKILKIIKTEFEKKIVRFLNTARALDEGYNVEGIELAILYAITSTKRNFIQRIGRALRFIVGKRAIIVVLYIKETQEEQWLKRAQQGEVNIRWINTLDEIV